MESMMRMLRAPVLTCVVVLTALTRFAPAARAADDTLRFYGTWRTSIVINGQTVTMISVHDANGYANYIVTPTGNAPAGTGTFSAANGKYKTSAPQPNDSGTYHFLDDNTVVCSNAAGQTVTWKKETAGAQPRTPAQSSPQVSPQPAAPAAAASAPPPPAYDPSLPASTNAAIAAFNNKDYNTAWRDFMVDAQKGNAEAQAGIGAMLFKHMNPPGTGYYAQCEKWLLASANQGNVKGMDFLGQYYYEVGSSIAGGINPGHNTAPIPPALQQQADGKFVLARQWFERASARNDGYAMGNLAIMLDAGVGGPADKPRAAQLREQLKHLTDPNFAKKATSDPGKLAMSASWQSGHYADALKNAHDMAAKGDADAEALLGKAYYEGVGVGRDYKTALMWINKAVAQNNADAIFILGLMTEFGRGVNQDLQQALALFDKAGAMGQRYAQMEAKGMRMQGEADAQQARFAKQCASRGGVADGPECLLGGMVIDPY
jgi:TPR repeat protein